MVRMRALLLVVLLVGCGAASGGAFDPDAGDGPRRGGAEVSGQLDGAAAPDALPADGAAPPFDPAALPPCRRDGLNPPPMLPNCTGIRHVRRNAATTAPTCMGRALGRYICVVCEWQCHVDGVTLREPLRDVPCRETVSTTFGGGCEGEQICVARCEDCPPVPAPTVNPWCAGTPP